MSTVLLFMSLVTIWHAYPMSAALLFMFLVTICHAYPMPAALLFTCFSARDRLATSYRFAHSSGCT